MYKSDLQALFDDCLLHCSIDETALHRVFDRLLLDETIRVEYGYNTSQPCYEELAIAISDARKLLHASILKKDGSLKTSISAAERDAIFDAYTALPDLAL